MKTYLKTPPKINSVEDKNTGLRTVIATVPNSKTKILQQIYDRAGLLIEEQSAFDKKGKAHSITKVTSPTTVETIADENQDGFFEKTEIRELKKNDRLITITIRDQQNKIVRQQVFRKPLDEELSEPSFACQPTETDYQVLRQIRSLSGLATKAMVTTVRGPWTKTSYGVLIHQSCLKLHGDIVNLVQQSWGQGLACLLKLDGKGSIENVARMAMLLENEKNPPKIRCDTEKWTVGTLARATIAGDPGHPTITLNPKVVDGKNLEKLKVTVFHEVFHNCGHLHELGIEYAYTCSECCLERQRPENGAYDKQLKNLSCNLCKGNYTGPDDPQYLANFAEWGQLTTNFHTAPFFMKELLSEPRDPKMLHYLLKIYSSPYFFSELYRQTYDQINQMPRPPGLTDSLNPTTLPDDIYVKFPNLTVSAVSFSQALVKASKGQDEDAIRAIEQTLDTLSAAKQSTLEKERSQAELLREQSQNLAWALYIANEGKKDSRSAQRSAKAFAVFEKAKAKP